MTVDGNLVLGPAEEAAYLLLVDQQPATLAGLAAAWSRPERLPAVVARLRQVGLVEALAGEPERFVAANPEVVVQAVLAERERRLDQAHEHARALAAAFREARAGTEPLPVADVVTGRRAVGQCLAQTLHSARTQVRCLYTPPQADEAGTTADHLDLLDVDVECRTVYDAAAIGREGGLPDMKRLVRTRQQARVLPDLPVRLYLADDRLAVVSLPPGPGAADSAVVVRPCALLDALGTLFEGLWERAVPLHTSHPADAPRRGATDDQRLVALLLSGLTDEAIARHLGVGYRTVQRRIATLMAELGARSRFQAGVQAALRFPHPPPPES